ncbi:piggyBac transposable element-derived protein 4-like [Stegodyphus dumicola]|uniref:piggyBac transposable element-derived protein 4-like n=1 Tax=Stegodyphus dumicola TaxID=202533 RepID=UPI0015A98525|nr:piggyBac transposable element-derived protein 4-like [Stegodyphus dumicola]
MAFQKGKICVLKWQDKKPISFLSTYHGTDFETLSKNDKLIRKPTAIIDYNKKMGGVDKADQCLAYYPVIRNQQRKYYKKIFRHLLDQAVWNAFVIYTKCGGLNRHLEFRLRLIERLIEEHLTQLSHPNDASSQYGSIVRLTGRHFPSVIPHTGATRNNPSRRCVVCNKQRNDKGKRIRRETRYWCEECNVGLCVHPCFKTYHTVQDF